MSNVNKGITQLGVINHYYWYRLRDEVGAKAIHSALAYFAPHDDGYLLDVSGAAVLKSSKHQKAAQALLAFLVSRQGETVLAKGDSFEYPLGSGTPANPELPPLHRAAAQALRPRPDRRRQARHHAAAAGWPLCSLDAQSWPDC